MTDTQIEPFHIDPKVNSKYQQHSIGLKINGDVCLFCTGSGDTFRDAKACAIKNAKAFLSKLKKLEENG